MARSSRILYLVLSHVLGAGLAPAIAQQVAEIQAIPANLTLRVDYQETVVAQLFDQRGAPIETADLRWTSSDLRVVRVVPHLTGPTATVLGIAGGIAQIQIAVGQVTSTIVVQVVAASSREPSGGVFLGNLGGTYVGEMVNGKPHGNGNLKYQADDPLGRLVYDGQWLNGLQHGRGTLDLAGGGRYNGEWRAGKYNGRGTADFADGSRYVGEFREGQFEGEGTASYLDGSRYIGEWRAHSYHGKGTLYWADGQRLDGYWSYGRPTRGTWYYADGTRYEGEFGWLDDAITFHGKGTIYYHDGSRLDGNWTNGEILRGTIYYADGRRYEGEIRMADGLQKHGIGRLYAADGSVRQRGRWVNDEHVGNSQR
jgi:hypothetical protein